LKLLSFIFIVGKLPKKKIRQIEKINNRKEMSKSIGPDYQQQVLQIELKELNKN
jgi:hypothetical protein